MAIEAKLNSGNLGFSQEMATDDACGSLFPQQHNPPQRLNQFQNLPHRKNLTVFPDNNQSLFLPKSGADDRQSVAFYAHIEKQRMEMDRFIALESERLRLTLQEQRRQQTQLIIQKYESTANLLLHQKDEEIAKAVNRATELRNFIKRMEIENQAWQRAAKENEAAVASLKNTIERLKETAAAPSNDAAEDAESCCQNVGEQENGKNEDAKRMVCRCCNSRKSCVIMLPCRHMCSCKDCDTFLDSCPVCSIGKTASIEAFI